MKSLACRLAAWFVLACATAWAQVEAPLLGYLPDSGKIRPVYGIPAAAAIVSPLDYGPDFALLAVAPGQDYALASVAASGAVVLISPGHNPAPLAGVAPGPGRMVISPRGSSAAFWFADTQRAQIVSGLPDAPRVRDVDASSLGDAPDALAVSDDGQWLAGAWTDGVFALGPGGELRKLPLRERTAALAFFAGRQDLALATRFHIFSIQDVGGSATVSALYESASQESRTLDPAGLAVSSSNRHLVVAEKSGNLLTLDLTAGSLARFDCGCAPDGVFAMGRSLFRLTNLAGGAFKLFDAATGEVFFVPLAEAEGGRQ